MEKHIEEDEVRSSADLRIRKSQVTLFLVQQSFFATLSVTFHYCALKKYDSVVLELSLRNWEKGSIQVEVVLRAHVPFWPCLTLRRRHSKYFPRFFRAQPQRLLVL